MAEDTPQGARALLDFWFGTLGPDGMPPTERSERWFRPPPGFDAELAQRFGAPLEQALSGALDEWAATPHGRLALVLLLDQLTRNVYRGSARAFDGDVRARALCLAALDTEDERALSWVERSFLYMPLMHAEDADLQDRSVALYTALAAEAQGEVATMIAANRDYAVQHRDVIARFGRFPGRNEALSRPTTAEEQAYLEEHGGF